MHRYAESMGEICDRPNAASIVPIYLRAELIRYFGDQGRAFAATIPGRLDEITRRWSITVGSALNGARTAWVAPCVRSDGTPAVLRIAYPERRHESEAEALRTWGGRGSIRLFSSDSELHATLLERCSPGTPLSANRDVDEVIDIGTRLLVRLWSRGETSSIHSHLRALATVRAAESERRWAEGRSELDPVLIAEGIALWRELAEGGDEVLLHADFHPRNVLASDREPWLVIDPKPLVGDAGFEPIPLILEASFPRNLEWRTHGWGLEIARRTKRVCDRLGLDLPRVAAWGVARSVDWALFLAEQGDLAGAARAGAEAKAFASVT
jgi:streptomycin 6-kinase